MSSACQELHVWIRGLPIFAFPFDSELLPLDGVYLLFEKDETGHGGNRVVRVGTHTGEGQLISRIKQHFLHENKDRSIFRKNIGRSLLSQRHDPFLSSWEVDLTTKVAREKHPDIDVPRQLAIEKEVTQYIQEHFSFVVISIVDKAERLRLESKLISTVSLCDECRPSENWLGHFSPKEKIRTSGLWLVNELYKEPLSLQELEVLYNRVI